MLNPLEKKPMQKNQSTVKTSPFVLVSPSGEGENEEKMMITTMMMRRRRRRRRKEKIRRNTINISIYSVAF